MNCPCGTDQSFESCCAPFLSGKAFPDTAEKTMRSRYTAHVKANIPYIQKTLSTKLKKEFDEKAVRAWAEGVKWKGLKIVKTKKGGPDDETGVVEFVATFIQDGAGIEHHEVSEFRRDKDGHWVFHDGESHSHKEGEGHQAHHDGAKPVTQVRQSPKIGRNDPCPCGSGKKYKKCCEATTGL